MTDKLKSRKLWITFLAVVIIAFGQMLGLDIDVERMWALIVATSSYVFGQSVVDRSLAAKALPQLEFDRSIDPRVADAVVAKIKGEILP